jgi:hypothetical protein
LPKSRYLILFAAKEKLEIVKERDEPGGWRASRLIGGFAFAAFGGEKCSNYL